MPPRRAHGGGAAAAASAAQQADAGATPTRSPSRKRPRSTSATTKEAVDDGATLQVFVVDMEEVDSNVYIYGCTQDRRSVLLRAAGFRYSFTLQVPESAMAADGGLARAVEHDVRQRLPANMRFEVEGVRRRSLVGYQREEATPPMLRVYPSMSRGSTSRIIKAFEAVVG